MTGMRPNLGLGSISIRETLWTSLQPALILPPVDMFSELIGVSGALTSSSRCHDEKSQTVLRSPWPSSSVLHGTKCIILIVTQPPGLSLLVLNGHQQLFTIDPVQIHHVHGVIHLELGTTWPGIAASPRFFI